MTDRGTFTEGPPDKPFTMADLEETWKRLKEWVDREDTLKSPVFTEFRVREASLEAFKALFIRGGVTMRDNVEGLAPSYRGIPIVCDELIPENFIMMVGPKHIGWLNLENGEMAVMEKPDFLTRFMR